MPNETIRILHVLGGLNIGGAENFVMNIYRNIDKSKIQFDFIVHNDEEGFYEQEVKKLGGKIYRVCKYRGFNHLKYKYEWNKFFKSHSEYKIIHSHVRSTASILLKIAKKYKLSTICHSHSTSNGRGLSSLAKNFLQKRIPKYADYLFACSFDSGQWLYGRKFSNSDKCYIIKNSIEANKYVYNKNTRIRMRKLLNLEDKIVLVQVGRIIEVKNYDFTIDLLEELVKENSKYVLLIIGTGPLKERIKFKINNKSLDKNVLIFENRNDVNELLQAADIYLMPSLWEGLSLALVEAQTASLPCIISENVTDGILIKKKVLNIPLANKTKWINTIKALSSKLQRNNELEIIKKNGFDVEDNVKILSDFYFDIIMNK